MDSVKYIGMDVHKEAISIAVLNSSGKLVMECVIETKVSTILQFIQGLRGNLHVTFEEGTWTTWLYDLLKPHITKIMVCNPRRNALVKEGNKSDRIDAGKLAELLYLNKLKPVYYGEHGVRALEDAAAKAAAKRGENSRTLDAEFLLEPGRAEASIFIKPGHQFRAVDQLLTNFHLPQSTLVVLVSAFAGRELVLRSYHHAAEVSYRFYSYGDCMWIR